MNAGIGLEEKRRRISVARYFQAYRAFFTFYAIMYIIYKCGTQVIVCLYLPEPVLLS